MSRAPAATHSTVINGTRIFIAVDRRAFDYVDAVEQCDDCGRAEFELRLDRNGKPDCLLCGNCSAAYPLHVLWKG